MTTKTTTRAALTTGALLVTAGSALAGIPVPIEAGVHASSRVVQVHDGFGFSFDSGDTLSSTAVGPTSSYSTRTFAGANVTVDSLARFGSLTNDISFSGPVSSQSNLQRRVEGYAETGFEDGSVFVNSPGRGLGDTIRLEASFLLDIDSAMLFAEPRVGSGFGFLSFSYEFVLDIAGTAFAYEGTFRNYGDGQVLFDGEETPGLVNIEVDVPVGEVFSISALLKSDFKATATNVDFAGSFDAGSPGAHFQWAGFSRLPDGTGVSSENHDWNVAVPTPATAALGVMAVGFGVTRRRR